MPFLESIYPTEESHLDYICIDKACLIFKHCILNGKWDAWQKTSFFIVGSYHYTNHEVTDELCQKWCNPAPTNSSALNSIFVAHDKKGTPYYRRAFNTQVCVLFILGLKPLLTFFYIKACKQLNSWLDGF